MTDLPPTVALAVWTTAPELLAGVGVSVGAAAVVGVAVGAADEPLVVGLELPQPAASKATNNSGTKDARRRRFKDMLITSLKSAGNFGYSYESS